MKYRKRGKELRLWKEALSREEGCMTLKRVWKGKQGERSKEKAKVKITLEQTTKAQGGVEVIALLFL